MKFDRPARAVVCSLSLAIGTAPSPSSYRLQFGSSATGQRHAGRQSAGGGGEGRAGLPALLIPQLIMISSRALFCFAGAPALQKRARGWGGGRPAPGRVSGSSQVIAPDRKISRARLWAPVLMNQSIALGASWKVRHGRRRSRYITSALGQSCSSPARARPLSRGPNLGDKQGGFVAQLSWENMDLLLCARVCRRPAGRPGQSINQSTSEATSSSHLSRIALFRLPSVFLGCLSLLPTGRRSLVSVLVAACTRAPGGREPRKCTHTQTHRTAARLI